MSKNPHIMVIEARFYEKLSDALWQGAERALAKAGAGFARFAVPGALEIPASIRLAHLAGETGKLDRAFDGYVALGCVIRGETTHYETVCNESARGLMTLSVDHGLCIGNGILTCETEAQAWERASPDGQDKGGGAVLACLALIEARRRLGLN
jgi:6,7-dimethyl-8-ribityllumazine synthase